MQRYGVKQFRNYEFNPNVAPTDTVPIIRSSKSENVKLEIARFGMIPNWAKDKKIGVRFINARSETVDTLATFKTAFKDRRCVIPAAGFYEWKDENGKKIPYMVHRKDNGIMSLAGIWDYVELENEKIFSFSIITGPPSALTEPLHDRTPIILEDTEDWIANGGKGQFSPPNDNDIMITRKNPSMNNPRMKDQSKIDF